MYTAILKHIEKKMGECPRKFNFWDKLTWLKLNKPSWDWENDVIRHTVLNWNRVFSHGKLGWGHIIQVNNLMFEKSPFDCPGDILIWNDHKPVDRALMEDMATRLYELKGYSEYLDDSIEKEYATRMENEWTRSYGLKVPESIAQQIDVKISTIFFQRKHIPDQVITHSFFPVLYLETDPMVVVMVPYKFWPKEFIEHWKD